ncbi:MAG: hypothetical protein ABIP44_05465 [Pseudoxanthomonas sp.]
MLPCPVNVSMILLPLALSSAGKVVAIEHYEGMAYEKDSGKLLYRESHWLHDGQRLVLYRCTNGKPFARKQVMGTSAAPDFELVDGRDGYREGVRTRAGKREVYSRASASSAENSRPIKDRDNQVIDAGFDTYVRQQWDELARSHRQRIAFLVPSRLQDMDFKISPMAGNANSRRYGLALDAWYGGVVPSMTVTYSNADRSLLRFEGIGNIRTISGKYPTVRIEFPADKRSAATRADLDGAANAPLVRSCLSS